MKSSNEELKNRGYIDNMDYSQYDKKSVDELKELLNSSKPYERTIAVRLLSMKSSAVKILLDRLVVEDALYTKLEICKVLEQGNENTCKIMTNYLGVIGKNQHKKVPKAVSKKKSYPLPRDLIARTMSHMSTKNINEMLLVLNSGDLKKISEVIDAIGFMIFYNQDLSTIYNFNLIKGTLEKYSDNDLIVWKCIECLSSFKLSDNITYLKSLKERFENPVIIEEINRSLHFVINLV